MIATLVLAAALVTAPAPPVHHEPVHHPYTVSVTGDYATLTLTEAPASVRFTSEPMAEGTLCDADCGTVFTSPMMPVSDTEWCSAWLVTWKDGATTAPSTCSTDTAAPVTAEPAPTPTPAPTVKPSPTPTRSPEPVKAPEPTKAPESTEAPAPVKAAEPIKAHPVKAVKPTAAPATAPTAEATPAPALAYTGAPDVSGLLLVGGGLAVSGTAFTATRRGRRK